MLVGVLLLVLALAALLSPAVLMARAVGVGREWGLVAVITAPVLLFQVVFWTGVAGVPLTFMTMLGGMVGLTLVLLLVAGRKASAPTSVGPMADGSMAVGPTSRFEKTTILAAAVMVLLMAVRCVQAPLTGYDTVWRWEGLAWTMQQQHGFNFYPPRTGADYALYPWPDGIAPLVSSVYWWLYAAWGARVSEITAVFPVAQYAALFVLVYRLTKRLVNARAAAYAVGVGAACPLLFRGFAIGQEIGCLTLGLVALTYFILTADDDEAFGRVIVAGLCAALATLAREYGGAFALYGLVLCIVKRLSWHHTSVYVFTVLLTAVPWYVRNWIFTGNPVYSLALGHFPTNPVLMYYLETVRKTQNVQNWTPDDGVRQVVSFLRQAPFQLLLVCPACVLFPRFKTSISGGVLLAGALWISAIGRADGGVFYTERVLCTGVALASILIGAFLARRTPRGLTQFTPGFLIVSWTWTFTQVAAFPVVPTGFTEWRDACFITITRLNYEDVLRQVTRSLPPGGRILARNTYLTSALRDTGIKVVQLWSPEVRFLFDAPNEADDYARLHQLHIDYVCDVDDPTRPLARVMKTPLFAYDRSHWRAVVRLTSGLIIYRLPETP